MLRATNGMQLQIVASLQITVSCEDLQCRYAVRRMEYDGKIGTASRGTTQRESARIDKHWLFEVMRHTETDSHGLEESRPRYRAIWTVNVEILESQSPCRHLAAVTSLSMLKL